MLRGRKRRSLEPSPPRRGIVHDDEEVGDVFGRGASRRGPQIPKQGEGVPGHEGLPVETAPQGESPRADPLQSVGKTVQQKKKDTPASAQAAQFEHDQAQKKTSLTPIAAPSFTQAAIPPTAVTSQFLQVSPAKDPPKRKKRLRVRYPEGVAEEAPAADDAQQTSADGAGTRTRRAVKPRNIMTL